MKTKTSTDTNENYIAAARTLYEEEGVLEFDDVPSVSAYPGAGGAYVACWVWVSDEDANA